MVLVAHPLLAAARQARQYSTRIVNLDLSGAVDESNLAKVFHESTVDRGADRLRQCFLTNFQTGSVADCLPSRNLRAAI
jgi:hypothetical protein